MQYKNVIPGLWRGSRPEAKTDLQLLVSANVRTIISLETWWHSLFHTFDEGQNWRFYFGRTFVSMPLSNILPPSRKATFAILDEILHAMDSQKAGDGVFVHCYSGVDRTGWMIAAYRVNCQGWSPEKAWQEAIEMGQHPRYRWWEDSFMDLWE